MMLPFRSRLYFFYQNGCDHCRKAEPVVRQFASKNPVTVLLVRLNAAARDNVLGYSPQGTPAYVLAVGNDIVWRHEGVASFKRLQAAHDRAAKQYARGEVGEEDSEDSVPKTRRGREDAKDEEEE